MTQPTFKPNCLPVLIGSLPMEDHAAAADLVFAHTPEIPLWVQLPKFPQEGMIEQFIPVFPGLATEGGKTFIRMSDDAFSNELVSFYEAYMAVNDDGADIEASRFAMTPERAAGFFTFIDKAERHKGTTVALKGQITGPITFATGVKDENGRAVFYDDQARDVAVKLLALKARWQTKRMAASGKPVIVFLDEPALAGFGSSEFISISKEDVIAALNEVIDGVHAEGGLAGIHVCANTEWDMVMASKVDIVNFDAFSYFDKFVLYADALRKFINAGKMVAWGIVPTADPADIDQESADALADRWEEQMKGVEALGIDRGALLAQSFIAPSCGTGSLDLAHATRVLELTRDASAKIRSRNNL